MSDDNEQNRPVDSKSFLKPAEVEQELLKSAREIGKATAKGTRTPTEEEFKMLLNSSRLGNAFLEGLNEGRLEELEKKSKNSKESK